MKGTRRCNARPHDTEPLEDSMRTQLTLEERFWPKVDKNGPIPPARADLGPCWLWTASLTSNGYGQIGGGSGAAHYNKIAHRLSYAWLVGPVPNGLELDHLCRVRHCVNPSHLEPVPHVVNARRGEAGKYLTTKTHCPRGHEYAPSNVVISNGGRACRECHRIEGRERYRRLAGVTPDRFRV